VQRKQHGAIIAAPLSVDSSGYARTIRKLNRFGCETPAALLAARIAR